MNYALGCAFSLDDVIMNFPYKKLKITCKECEQINNNNHRNILIKQIIQKSVQIILNDIIDNNITFWFPLTGNKKCNIHMKRITGDDFKNLRKSGKWKDIDIVKSMFSGYEIKMFMLGKRTPRVKTVYLNKELRDKISYNINQGKQYGDNNNDKYIKDYYENLFKAFPKVSHSDIMLILNYSWKSIYLHNSYGGDTVISNSGFWCYIGNLRKDPLKHFYYYIRKLTVKLRVLYRRKKIEWDGYYYFALSNSQYESYLNQKNKRGRPKKYFNFGTVYLYEILDECKINEHYKQYIFRIPYISKIKIKQFIPELITGNAELIITRSPLKFKDILINNNEYDFI